MSSLSWSDVLLSSLLLRESEEKPSAAAADEASPKRSKKVAQRDHVARAGRARPRERTV